MVLERRLRGKLLSVLFIPVSPVPRTVARSLQKQLSNEKEIGGDSPRKLLRTAGTKFPGQKGKLDVQYN